MAIQHLRSSTANKRPTPAAMSDGQLAVNTNTASPGLFFKDSAGALIKVGPVHVGTTAPNASPASGGETGNTVGEQWLDTTGGTYVFKVWDGSAWRSESGTFVDVNGDVMTGALGIIAGSAGSPGLYFSGDTNTGLYSPGADQVAISTGGSGRLFVDASGRVGLGSASSSADFLVGQSTSPTMRIGSDSTFYGAISHDYANAIVTVGQYGTYGNAAMRFLTQGSERLRITSAGLVGVGASSAPGGGDSRMWIDQAGTNDYGLLINASGGVKQPTLWFRDASATLSGKIVGQSGLTLATSSSATAAITIDTSQRVGVGTTSPSSLFHVDTVANATAITVAASTSTGGQLRIGTGGATAGNQSILSTGNGLDIGTTIGSPITFFTNGTANEHLRIDSSGRLLVGTSSSSLTAKFVVQARTDDSTGNGAVVVQRGSIPSAANQTLGAVQFTDSSGNYGAWILGESDGGGWTSGSNHRSRLVFSTTADGASSPTERMRIGNGGLTSIGGVYTFTTGNAANVNVDSSGYLQRSTSSIKYKTDVETLDDQYADALLACRPVWYRSTCEHDCPEHSYWGFIAEEVAAIDPRLVHWKTTEITHDENGAAVSTPCTPEPEGVQYERFVPHLLNLIKRQKEQIEAMEARLTALESA